MGFESSRRIRFVARLALAYVRARAHTHVYTRGKNIFTIYTGDRRNPLPNLGSPLKGDRRSGRSKFRGGAFCPRDVPRLFSFCQRSLFLLRSPSSSLSPSFSIPPALAEPSTGGRRKTHDSASPPLSYPSPPRRSTSESINDPESGLSSPREITDRRSSSVARAADSSQRASRCGHQSLVNARLVVEMPMREEEGDQNAAPDSSNRDEKPPPVASRRLVLLRGALLAVKTERERAGLSDSASRLS